MKRFTVGCPVCLKGTQKRVENHTIIGLVIIKPVGRRHAYENINIVPVGSLQAFFSSLVIGAKDEIRLQSFLQDGLRPVIYYCQHLMQDMDEEKTFSRALISFVKYDNPKTRHLMGSAGPLAVEWS